MRKFLDLSEIRWSYHAYLLFGTKFKNDNKRSKCKEFSNYKIKNNIYYLDQNKLNKDFPSDDSITRRLKKIIQIKYQKLE